MYDSSIYGGKRSFLLNLFGVISLMSLKAIAPERLLRFFYVDSLYKLGVFYIVTSSSFLTMNFKTFCLI